MAFFTKIEQTTVIFVWTHKGPQIAKATLKKENKLEASPSLTSHYTMKLQSQKKHRIVIKTGTWTRGTEQRFQKKNPRQMRSVKVWQRGSDTPRGKDGPHRKQCWETWTPHAICTAHRTDKTWFSTPSPSWSYEAHHPPPKPSAMHRELLPTFPHLFLPAMPGSSGKSAPGHMDAALCGPEAAAWVGPKEIELLLHRQWPAARPNLQPWR